MNPLVNIISFLYKNLKNYDIIHAHSYIFLTSFQCALLRKIKRFPLVLHIHGGVQTSGAIGKFSNFQLAIKNYFFDRTLGSFTIKKSDAVISVSENDLNILKERQKNVEMFFHIPNGVDTDRFNILGNVERKYITFIGRLTYIKGIDLFIEMIKKLYDREKNYKFLIIGEGPLKELVMQAKEEIPIKYIPKYPYDRIENVYRASKVLILTSRYEGLPTTVLESLACGTPVIATDVGGMSEVIHHNNNGLLIQANSFLSSLEDIANLINDKSKLEKMGQNGRQFVIRNFGWQKIVKEITKIYESLLFYPTLR